MQNFDNTKRAFSHDLELLRVILAEKPIVELHRPLTFHRFRRLLKHKTEFIRNNPEKEKVANEWYAKKGIDMKLVKESIVSLIPAASQVAAAEDNYFFVKLSEKTLDEYLIKSKEYATMNLVQSVMSKNNTRPTFISRYIHELLEEGENRFKITWEKERNVDNKKQYVDIVQKLIEGEKNSSKVLKKLLPAIRNALGQQDHFIWQILYSQTESYKDTYNKIENMVFLARNSLKMVQKDFERRTFGIGFERYVQTKYINRVQAKAPFQKGGFWAKAFAFMTCGMKTQFINLLTYEGRNHSDIINGFLNYEQNILQGVVTATDIRPLKEINDAFYDQILHCLNGKTQYSLDLFNEPFCLEIIWIVLRTAGVFWQKKEDKFCQIRKLVVEKYLDATTDPQLVRQMLYLLDFDSVISLGPNAALNRDDYLHLLLALYPYDQMLSKPNLTKQLVPRLVEFILELIMQKNPAGLFYISLIPESCLVSEASALIVSSSSADTFNWNGLKNIIRQDLFNELVITTMSRMVNSVGNYITAAEKMYEIIGINEHSLDMVAQMLVRHFLQRQTFTSEELKKAENLGLKWSRQSDRTYERVFVLLQNLRELIEIVNERNIEKIKQFISKNHYIYIDSRAISMSSQILDILRRLNGGDVYFLFLKYIVRGAEIYMTKINMTEELKSFKKVVLQSCNQLLAHNSGLSFQRESMGSNLINELQQTI